MPVILGYISYKDTIFFFLLRYLEVAFAYYIAM